MCNKKYFLDSEESSLPNLVLYLVPQKLFSSASSPSLKLGALEMVFDPTFAKY
jgi:hypothetical protein